MTDQERREKLKNALEGYWEYECKVDSKTLFENDETSRGGFMCVLVTLPWIGVAAKIYAERLWATKIATGGQPLQQNLETPVKWAADGGVLFSDGQLWFRYTASDVNAAGETTDTFLFSEETLNLNPGEFKHYRADGRLVTGTVRLKKMAKPDAFEWAPPGVSSLVTTVAIPPKDRPIKTDGGTRKGSARSGDIYIETAHGPVGTSNTNIDVRLRDVNVELNRIRDMAVRHSLEAILRDTTTNPELSNDVKAIVANEVDKLRIELMQQVPNQSRVNIILQALGKYVPTLVQTADLVSKIKAMAP